MQKVISFEDFLLEKELAKVSIQAKSFNFKKELVDALVETHHFDIETNFVLESAAKHGLYEELWEGTISEDFFNSHLNEVKFAEWIADKGKKAVQAVKSGAEKAKEKSTQIASKVLKSFSTFGQFILKAITGFLKKAWEYIKGQVSKKYDSIKDKTVELAAKRLKGKEGTLSTETKNLGSMCTTGVKFVTGGAVKGIAGDIKSAGSEEASNESREWDYLINSAIVECVHDYGSEFIDEIVQFSEMDLNEGGSEDHLKIPGLSKLVAKIGKKPFFKQLHKFQDKATEYSNKALEKASYILNKVAGGPGPFKFVTIGIIVGIAAEKILKKYVRPELEELVQIIGKTTVLGTVALAIPLMGFLVKLAFWVADGLWYYGTASAVVGILKNEFSGAEEAIDATKDSASKLEDEASKDDEEKDSEEKEEK